MRVKKEKKSEKCKAGFQPTQLWVGRCLLSITYNSCGLVSVSVTYMFADDEGEVGKNRKKVT